MSAPERALALSQVLPTSHVRTDVVGVRECCVRGFRKCSEGHLRRQLPPAQATTRPRWHNLCMDNDGQLELYTAVAAQLKEAHASVRALQVPEGVRMALTRKLLVITAAAKHDLADAARRLERFRADLEEGRFPEEER
jgi:hypothetical protein